MNAATPLNFGARTQGRRITVWSPHPTVGANDGLTLTSPSIPRTALSIERTQQ